MREPSAVKPWMIKSASDILCLRTMIMRILVDSANGDPRALLPLDQPVHDLPFFDYGCREQKKTTNNFFTGEGVPPSAQMRSGTPAALIEDFRLILNHRSRHR